MTTAAGFETEAAVAICTGALQDPSPSVRAAACDAWATRRGPSAAQLLVQRFETDTDVSVRLRALQALGELGDASVVPLLGKALDDADPLIRQQAMQTLAQISGRDFGDDPDLWRQWILDPNSPRTRWTLAEAWRTLF